jgi:hypothetical protein
VRLTQAAGLRRLLDALGIDVVYGPGGDWPIDVEVDSSVAVALASVHRRVHGLPAAAHLGEGRFVLGGFHADDSVTTVVHALDDVGALADQLRDALATDPPMRVELAARFDPRRSGGELVELTPPGPPSWMPPGDALVARVAAAERPMVIAGPGVVAAGAVADLRALAAAADLGVINTWGAKGVFDWRSRHHWATVGLQARDLELGGVPESDLVALTGIDADELDLATLEGRPTVEVPPASLGPLAEVWSRPRRDVAMPALRARLAGVTQDGWARTELPMAPSQVTRNYSELVSRGGFVAADPGIAGYWVARTLGTTRLGGAKVPARRAERGSAIASVIVARLRRPGASALAVVDGPLREVDEGLLDAARRLGVHVPVEMWSPDGQPVSVDDHARRVDQVMWRTDVAGMTVATDTTQLDRMIEAAGPVTAWGGLVHELIGGSAT